MSVCTTEIQRLAMKMPDHLMLVYDQLQTKINEIVATENVDDRTRIAFHTFLFTIKYKPIIPLLLPLLLPQTDEMAATEQKILTHNCVNHGWKDISSQFVRPGGIRYLPSLCRLFKASVKFWDWTRFKIT